MRPLILLGASYAEPGTPIAGELARVLRRPVLAHGVRGASLNEWARTDWSQLPSDADVLVLELGGNGPVAADAVRSTHRALSRHFSGDVAWAIPPRWAQTGEIAERRATATRAIIAADVPRVDSGYRASSSDVARDGVHLTRPGYLAYARSLSAEITRHVRIGRVLRVGGAVLAAAAVLAFVGGVYVG